MSSLSPSDIGLAIEFGGMSSWMKVLPEIPMKHISGMCFLLFTYFVGHILKNDQTQMAHAVRLLNAEYRLLLTGTPLQKYLPKPSPLYIIVNMLTTVHCTNCGHYSIFCIQMFSPRKPRMHSNEPSISPRGRTIPPSSIAQVLF